MTVKAKVFLLLLLFVALSCRHKSVIVENNIDETEFDNSEKVYREAVGKDTIIACTYKKIEKQVVDFPLSSLVDTCFIAKLENKKNALIELGQIIISENYIGVNDFNKQPYRLFDKNGKYIRNIGDYGKGPNEYLTLYHQFIDENKGIIYLLPFFAKNILCFDIKGNALKPIPLAYNTNKAIFRIDNDTITIVDLPFSEKSTFAYRQTLSGKVIDFVNAGNLSMGGDFSNEIISCQNSSAIDFHLSRFWNRLNDTLYHYKDGRIIPVFTMNFNSKNVPIHQYIELPNHYSVIVMSPKKGPRNTSTVVVDNVYLIDKKTLSVQCIRLINDFYGGIEMNVENAFRDGLFIGNLPAIEVKERIKTKLIQKQKLLNEDIDLLENMDESININDNNIIFWGKLKK